MHFQEKFLQFVLFFYSFYSRKTEVYYLQTLHYYDVYEYLQGIIISVLVVHTEFQNNYGIYVLNGWFIHRLDCATHKRKVEQSTD